MMMKEEERRMLAFGVDEPAGEPLAEPLLDVAGEEPLVGGQPGAVQPAQPFALHDHDQALAFVTVLFFTFLYDPYVSLQVLLMALCKKCNPIYDAFVDCFNHAMRKTKPVLRSCFPENHPIILFEPVLGATHLFPLKFATYIFSYLGLLCYNRPFFSQQPAIFMCFVGCNFCWFLWGDYFGSNGRSLTCIVSYPGFLYYHRAYFLQNPAAVMISVVCNISLWHLWGEHFDLNERIRTIREFWRICCYYCDYCSRMMTEQQILLGIVVLGPILLTCLIYFSDLLNGTQSTMNSTNSTSGSVSIANHNPYLCAEDEFGDATNCTRTYA
jgi:hypothetical protein